MHGAPHHKPILWAITHLQHGQLRASANHEFRRLQCMSTFELIKVPQLCTGALGGANRLMLNLGTQVKKTV